jgi:hypothetical protein
MAIRTAIELQELQATGGVEWQRTVLPRLAFRCAGIALSVLWRATATRQGANGGTVALD